MKTEGSYFLSKDKALSGASSPTCEVKACAFLIEISFSSWNISRLASWLEASQANFEDE